MSTPGTLNGILTSLRERLADAEKDAADSHRAAMNSYGAGYERGYADALAETIRDITGEDE